MKKHYIIMKSICAVMALCLVGVVSFAQEKGLPYYNEHGNEILPDAQAAFRNGDYARTVNLCEWQFIVVGNHKADELKEKASRCEKWAFEMEALAAGGQKDAAREKALAILALNPDDKRAKAIEEAKYAEKGYMDIAFVDFANVDSAGKILTEYGGTLFKDEMRYLRPKVFYNGLSSTYRTIELFFKIYGPKGKLQTGSNSPDGYTWKETVYVYPGESKSFITAGWGNKGEGLYSTGTHHFEIWYDGNRLYSTTFEINERSNALSRGEWLSQMRKVVDNASMTYDNGAYKGQLDGSIRNGLGMYWWSANNTFYWGGWKGGTRDGMAIYLVSDENNLNNCPDCKFYVGYNNNGDKNGKGTCYDKFGNLIYYGNFSAGSPTEPYPSSGSYSEYKFECIDYNNGNRYIGETRNGKRHGEGIFLWSDGGAWFGSWKEGQRSGEGLYIPYSGSVQYGQWFGDVKAPTQTVLTKTDEVSCDGVYHGPDWEYNYKQTGLYESLGNQFNRNFFSIALDYYIIPSDEGYDSKWSDNNNIITIDTFYRAFSLLLVNKTIHVKTNNGDNYFDTKIEFKCETWQHIDLVYNNGRVYINGQTLDVGELNGPGDNIISSVDFGRGNCFKGYIKNLVVKSN